MKNKISARFLHFPFTILALSVLTGSVCLSSPLSAAAAGSVPRPNDSTAVAEVFGDPDRPLPLNLTPPPDWQTGMERDFNVLDVTSGVMNRCTARIFLISENIVFWCDIREDLTVSAEIMDQLIYFDTHTLPMLRRTFGEEANPGTDNDPRFHVVFTDRIGDAYNGYFSAQDSADPRIRPASNGMELVFLNTRLLRQGPEAVIDTLSHEYQHMIHHYHDTNELSFINEGLSQLAEYLSLGKLKTNFIRAYLNDTGRSLIWWPENGTTAPYYGSSFLFSLYLYDRFGTELIHTLAETESNGLDGLDNALQACNISYTADEVFRQWTAALLSELIQKPASEWKYRSVSFPQGGIYRDIRTLPCGSSELHETAQYGLRLYNSSCGDAFRITITGNEKSPVTSLQIPQGNSAWWSGAVSNSMALLSHDFDLRETTDPVFFEYDVNYAIENGYDYYYLLLQDGNGKVTRLTPSTASDDDPAGQNLGQGTTGRSDRPIHEKIDLSGWCGQQIRITFVYLTDTAGLSDGLLVDNIRIDAIGFRDDAETDENDWEAEGFSRINAAVPQHFSLTVLHPQHDGSSLAEFHSFEGGTPFSIICPEGNCSFAISPVNSEIRARASFTIQTDMN
ncbi:MAG: immune inhibitor A [Anaerolineaceae bacterium]|nr:immune inhibitor A [Anaerolineaceae bacterium]